MEPNLGPERVPGVQPERVVPLDRTRRKPAALQAVSGEPRFGEVYDLESRLELPLSDEQLRAEFHEFYRSARERVGRALALTLHDTDLAADAVDEAMVRAYQQWSRVRALDNPAGWAYHVGLNHARSRLRRLARRLTGGAPAALVGNESAAEPAITAALAELSVDHRSVIVCRLFLDWSEADTATALRIRPGTVKSRLNRALAQLEPRLAHLRPEGTP
jgi:DNA-directed RNA polymerase specialized sigma24 family protein